MLRTHDRPKKRRNRNRLEATGNGSKLRFTAMLHFQAFSQATARTLFRCVARMWLDFLSS